MSEGDVQRVIDALSGILSGDAGVRTKAAGDLEQYTNVDGYLEMLLQLAHDDSQPQTLRTGAASQFKAVVNARWSLKAGVKESSNYLEVKAEEKATLRGNILGALVTRVVPVRNLLEDAMRTIVSLDYPNSWVDLPDAILGALNTDNFDQIVAALLALRAILKRCDSSANVEKRDEMFAVADATFPILKDMFTHLLENDSLESQEVQNKILGVLWDGTMFGLPTCMRNHEFFDGWMRHLLAAFSLPLPPNAYTEMDEHAFRKLPWWPTKRTVLHLWIRWCNRFLRKASYHVTDGEEFREFFSNTYPSLFLEKSFEAFSAISNGFKWEQRTLVVLLDFFNVALSLSVLWQQLKPHVWDIVKGVFMPMLCFNEDDLSLFEYEPDVYLANQLDPQADETNPRCAASTFIFELAKRRDPLFLQELISYLTTEFLRPHSSAPSVEAKLALSGSKYAALDLLGTLCALLKENPDYLPMVEALLAEHVIPDMHDGPAWLRAKACWTFSRYCRIEFEYEENLISGLNGILKNLLEAEELPLVADAAVALFDLIPNKLVRPHLGPVVPQLVSKYLSLMERVDNDAIVSSLQYLMRYFPRPIQKSAEAVVSNLTTAFLRANHNSNQLTLGDDTDADNAFMAASQTIRAIHTLYKAIRKSPSLYPALEPYAIPVLEIGFSRTGAHYIEDVLAMMTEITYFTPAPFSPEMWGLFDKICQAYMSWAPDYMQTMLPSLDNFISRDKETFLSEPRYLEQLCDFASKYFVDPKYAELDLLPLTRVFEVLLLEHMGALDHIIEPLLKLTVDRLAMGGSIPIQVILLELVMNCMFYNAAITCHWLESNGVAQMVLKLLFDLIVGDHFERICDKKTTSLGLGAMLRLPMEQLPAYVQEKFLEIVATYMQLTQQAEEQRIEQMADVGDDDEDYLEDEEFDEEMEEMEEDDEDDMDWGDALDSDEDDDDEMNEAQLEQAIAMMKANVEEEEGEPITQEDVDALLGHARKVDDHEDVPDAYGPAGNLTERFLDHAQNAGWTLTGQEASDELPTDEIEEIVFLAETLHALDPAVSEQLLASFDPDMKALYDKLMEVATDKVEKQAFNAELKAAKAAKNQELRAMWNNGQ
jgi:hypothetical protein